MPTHLSGLVPALWTEKAVGFSAWPPLNQIDPRLAFELLR